jgi:hypothetical protein
MPVRLPSLAWHLVTLRSRPVKPSATTTYTLIAKGPGGTKDASARVTVNARIAEAVPSPTDQDLFGKNMKDVFFDYDKSAIRPVRDRCSGPSDLQSVL